MEHPEKVLIVDYSGQVLTLWLNRPHLRNALNEELIARLTQALLEVPESVSLVIIRGMGKAFCAGADLNYMERMSRYTDEENLADALRLEALFAAVQAIHCPVLVIAHGAVMGGANGLLAAADLVAAADDTVFAFSEVRLGIVPAVISPYVLRRMKPAAARELMLTGRRFNAKEAYEAGLVTKLISGDAIDTGIQAIADTFEEASPAAVARCKRLINHVECHRESEHLPQHTARVIADARASAEGREGLLAFLQKRKPDWNNTTQP